MTDSTQRIEQLKASLKAIQEEIDCLDGLKTNPIKEAASQRFVPPVGFDDTQYPLTQTKVPINGRTLTILAAYCFRGYLNLPIGWHPSHKKSVEQQAIWDAFVQGAACMKGMIIDGTIEAKL